MIKKNYNWLYYILGAIILLIPALSNNYPFVYSDSGAYINIGFTNTVPNDRPIFYGWFLRHISLKQSFWFPVFLQSLIVFFYIHLFVKYYSNIIYKQAFALLLTLVLTFTTGVGLFTGKLMPDIFTPLILLSAFLLISQPKLLTYEKILICIVLYFGLMVHISHLLIIFLLLFVAMFYAIIKHKKKFTSYLNFGKRFIIIIIISILSGLTIPTTNYFNYGTFEMTKGSHVFLMARLSESGILQKYLDDNCKENNFQLCDYKDKLPSSAVGFIWYEESPFYQTGSWLGSKTEYNKIIKNILLSPKYWKYLLIDFSKQTIKQFFTISPGTIVSHRENTPPYWEIETKMKHELSEYKNSIQYVNGYDISDIERRQTFLFYLSIAIFIVSLFTVIFNSSNTFTNKGVVLIILLLFLNAFVCGALANIVDRLQGRVVWVLPMVALIIAVNYIIEKKHPQLKDSE